MLSTLYVALPYLTALCFALMLFSVLKTYNFTALLQNKAYRTVDISIAIIFGSAFIFYLVSQHFLVFPYQDDWGYATLSYFTESPQGVGRKFTQSDLLSFLIAEYQSWTGRILAFYIQINLFKAGLNYVRVIQVLVILSIIIISIFAFYRSYIYTCLVLVLFVYYFSLPEFIIIEGVYWFSASIAYLWGLPFIFLSALLYRNNNSLSLVTTVLLAVAALFQEQVALAAIAFAFTNTLISQIERINIKVLFKSILSIIVITAASCTVIFSPGNFSRSALSRPEGFNIVETVALNAKSIFLFIGSDDSFFVMILISISVISFCLFGKTSERSGKKGKFVLSSLALMSLYLHYYSQSLSAVVIILLVCIIIITETIYDPHFRPVALCCASALASLVLLLVSPGVAGRSLIPFYFLMMPFVVYAANIMCAEFNSNKYVYIVFLFVFLTVSSNSMLKAHSIYIGFKSNENIHLNNEAKLINFDPRLKSPIYLHKLIDDKFAGVMPYQRPLVEHWLRRYYEIPENASIVWK